MRKIDVCLSPDLMHLYHVEERSIVVVDILRATSCMTTALAQGVESITPFANLDACKAMKEQGFYTAGERDGKKVEGFDLGNSPFEYMGPGLRGKRIAFTTTNGTQAIEKSKTAREIIIGSFLNLGAVANYLLQGTNDVLIVCAGWKGKFNMEDTLFAGALVELVQDQIEAECDAPVAARDLYLSARYDLLDYLKDASHVKRLARLNIQKDIAFCVTPNQYPIVPRLIDGKIII